MDFWTGADRVVTATWDVDASAGDVFGLIADPAVQPRWDGNGNLGHAAEGQRIRGVGEVFTMTLSGGSVRENHVVDFVEGRRLAWKPAEPGRQPPGHCWRWELEPLGESRTRVTHTYDWSELTDPGRLAHARSVTPEDLQASLTRLAALAESSPAGTGSVVVEVAAPTSHLGRAALRAYVVDIASRWYGRPATPGEVDDALAADPSDDLAMPTGLLLVAHAQGEVVGCAGLRLLGDGLAETKRVFVVPTARGRGLGRRLVADVEEHARAHGVQTLRLDTRSDLVEARTLYTSMGYREVPAFNAGAYADHWFAKELTPPPGSDATPGQAAVGEDGWLGLWNARDLGGTRAADGGSVREGALVRSEAPVRLDESGWTHVVAHGVRTVVDLRTSQEAVDKPSTLAGVDIDVVNVSLEEGLEDDEQFASWASSRLIGTPLYYEPFLARWPERCVRALRAVAEARPGGVLVHCAKGRDRTGLVVALVLLVCGVGVEEIVEDYAETERRLAGATARAAGAPDEREETQRVLATQGFTETAAAMRHFLVTADPLVRLRAAGLRPRDEAALRARMLGHAGAKRP